MHILGHFKTITKHKILVAKGCFKVGLYCQGIMHDMSKYSPTEFIPGAKYYQGNQSPNNIERRKYGISRAWLHHKGRNRSPLEYFNNGIGASIMHEASKDYLMMLLTMYAEKGEKETFRYLKRDLKEDISGYDRISPFEKTGPVAIG